MASTFANRDTNWYIRVAGNELNGGGFDSTVSGAGTNYADSDSTIVSSTTGTCAVAASTTFIDASANFPSDIVGNVLRASAKTGGTAIALDYFVVTAWVNSTTLTLDRAMAASTDITAMTYRIGGAHAHIKSYASSSGSGSNNPALATPLIGGNTINIRGGGTQDPGASDYDWSADYWNFPSGGNITGGNVKIIGYNGRPRISHRGLLWFTGGYIYVKNLSMYQSNSTWTTHTPFDVTTASFYNCIFDTAGIDAQSVQFGDGSNNSGAMLCCEIRNSGGGAAGTTNFGVAFRHGGALIYGTWIHGLRSNGVIATGCYGALVNCLINSNGNDGYYDAESEVGASQGIPIAIMNCTFNANGGHGLNFAANGLRTHFIVNNIVSNHVTAGKYGINFADTYKINQQKYRTLFGYNNYYGNSVGNFNSISSIATWTINPSEDGVLVGDLTVDPQYTNAASNDFTPGANVKSLGLHSYNFGTTAYKINMGGVFT